MIGDVAVGKKHFGETAAMGYYPTAWSMTLRYSDWSINLMHDGKPYQFNLWNTNAWDNNDKLRPLGYHQTDIFLILFGSDGVGRRSYECETNSFESITKKWIPEITRHCPDTPYFIIRTKDDFESCSINITRNNLLVHGYLLQTWMQLNVLDYELQKE